MAPSYEMHEIEVPQEEATSFNRGQWVYGLTDLPGVRSASLSGLFGHGFLTVETTRLGYGRVLDVLDEQGVDWTNPCEACGNQPYPGILYERVEGDGYYPVEHVERCDACARYSTDRAARRVLRQRLEEVDA